MARLARWMSIPLVSRRPINSFLTRALKCPYVSNYNTLPQARCDHSLLLCMLCRRVKYSPHRFCRTQDERLQCSYYCCASVFSSLYSRGQNSKPETKDYNGVRHTLGCFACCGLVSSARSRQMPPLHSTLSSTSEHLFCNNAEPFN